MVSDVLLRLKPELALTLDADNHACGTYVGYGFTLLALNDKNCIIFNSWARKSALTTKTADDFFKEYMSKPENSFVKAYKAGEPNISAVLFTGNDDAQAVLDIKRFITDMVKYYSANYYSNACAAAYAAACTATYATACCKSGTANSAVELYGIPVPVAQPIADDQAVVTPTTVLPPATSNNSMDSVDPATAPESTGYSTAQSLAELKPPTNGNLPPINGGFSQPAYSPMNSNGAFVQQPMNNGGFVQRPMNSFGNDGRFVAGRPTAISQPANPIMGILGAFLFSLIGCAVWILIGKLGYISYLGGIAMAFSTIFGYHLFGKKFDVLGFITSIVIVLIMVLLSNMFIYTWQIISEPGIDEALSILGYEGFFSVFFGLFDLMKQVDLLTGLEGMDSMTGTFISDLVIGYIVSGIATVAIGVSMLKKDR